MQAGTTITLNSPDAFRHLYNVASSHWDSVKTAELMREVGLKSIAFNGVSAIIVTAPFGTTRIDTGLISIDPEDH